MEQQVYSPEMRSVRDIRLVELITYIANRFQDNGKFGLTKLAKIVFRIDQQYFAREGETFSGLTFFKFPKGPFTKDFYSIIGNTAHLDMDGSGTGPEIRVLSSREADMRPLVAFIDVIDKVIEEVWDSSASELSNESHGPAWELVSIDRHPIPIESYIFGDHRTVPDDVSEMVQELLDSSDEEV